MTASSHRTPRPPWRLRPRVRAAEHELTDTERRVTRHDQRLAELTRAVSDLTNEVGSVRDRVNAEASYLESVAADVGVLVSTVQPYGTEGNQQ